MSGAYPDRELPKMKAHRCNDRIEDVMQARRLPCSMLGHPLMVFTVTAHTLPSQWALVNIIMQPLRRPD